MTTDFDAALTALRRALDADPAEVDELADACNAAANRAESTVGKRG